MVEYTNIRVYPEEVIITADSDELLSFPFLFMTGHKLVRFSEAERGWLERVTGVVARGLRARVRWADETVGAITDRTRTLRGTLRLAGGMTVCLYVFPPLLKYLRRVHPQLDVRLRNDELVPRWLHDTWGFRNVDYSPWLTTGADVSAGDIQVTADVEILNPELPIATLNAKARLAVDITVERGRGYVSADRNKKSSTIGVVPVDSINARPPQAAAAFLHGQNISYAVISHVAFDDQGTGSGSWLHAHVVPEAGQLPDQLGRLAVVGAASRPQVVVPDVPGTARLRREQRTADAAGEAELRVVGHLDDHAGRPVGAGPDDRGPSTGTSAWRSRWRASSTCSSHNEALAGSVCRSLSKMRGESSARRR